jgi:hypothetical protein
MVGIRVAKKIFFKVSLKVDEKWDAQTEMAVRCRD